jgi:hypothetical protein
MTQKPVFRGLAAFIIVLLCMPLGHAAMIIMEKTMSAQAVNIAAFLLGLAGLALTLACGTARGETARTVGGYIGALLFWTGWIEFGYVYYAHRFGVMPLVENGQVVTKPEYLIMPSSAGFFAMMMLFYVCSVPTGCSLIGWLRRLLPRPIKSAFKPVPVVRNAALVTFMETNMILWGSYLLLLFCYDKQFLGDDHPLTMCVAMVCLIGSLMMFPTLLRQPTWGRALRYGIAVVVVFWTFVEVMGRYNLLTEIWVRPFEHPVEMTIIAVSLVALVAAVWINRKK